LERVLRGVPPKALKGAVDELGIGLTGRGPDLATIIESTSTLAELFAERSPEVEALLRNGTKVGDQFIASRKDFAEAVHQLVTVSDSLSISRPNLLRLLQNTNQTSDAVIRLLDRHSPAINKFLHEFALVNELQAQHADDLSALFLNLPTALDKINGAFEPDTGLVRFGLIQDNNNPACSYGTARRPPSDRSKRLPPKNAQCGSSGQQSTSSSSSPAPTQQSAPIPGVDDSLSLEGLGGPGLPSRMADWSWTLYYLRGIES
jgi:ABC-type transporter Mla subunit MlaD